MIAQQRNLDCGLVREGRNREVWTIGRTRLVIPRHREINEWTAQAIPSHAQGVRDDG